MNDDLISRQAVLDIINLNWYYRKNCIEAIEKLSPVNPQEPNMTWITGSDGAKIAFWDVPVWKVTKICEILADVVEAEEQEPKTGHWIPVSERLPEENKTVIASTEYGVCPEARYTKENGWEWAYESGADYWEELDGVRAWMPLPKSYEESDNNDR